MIENKIFHNVPTNKPVKFDRENYGVVKIDAKIKNRTFPEYPHITEVSDDYVGAVEDENGDIEFMNMDSKNIQPAMTTATLTVGQKKITKSVPKDTLLRRN